MRDYLEKYLVIQSEFPNKAGKLHQIVTMQKNLTKRLANQKQTDDVKKLLLLTAEGYDVTVELLDWFKNVLQGVLNDVGAIKDGATIRNTIEMQSALISELLAFKNETGK